jgi:undecaprenyl-diphosphatase
VESIGAFDLGFLYFFGSLHRPALDDFMKTVTHLGDVWPLSIGSFLLAGGLLAARRFRIATALAVSTLLALGIQNAGKALVARPRPDVAWRLIKLPNQSSFPSGHATMAMAIYGGLGLIVASRLRSIPLRLLAAGSGISLGLLVGISRPYLGVHYPIDVIAGWCAGLACALLALHLAGGWHPATPLLSK